MARVIKPGGMMIVSVRPKLYYVKYGLMNNKINLSEHVLDNNDGNSVKWYFNWFTSKNLVEKLQSVGIEKNKVFGIGVVSGIEEDPQSRISQPSLLDEKERAILYKIEMELSESYPDSGRYLLAIGKKREKNK
jgi:hypothetical protein